MSKRDRFVRIGEASKILDRHPHTLRNWDLTGVLVPTKRVKGMRYYSVKMLEEFMDPDSPATQPDQ